MSEATYPLAEALAQMQRIAAAQGERPQRLVVRKFSPGGMCGHGRVEVKSIDGGIDWYAGRVIITPATPLTELTPEEVAAIAKSVRAGASWHAYQREKKLHDKIAALEAEVKTLRRQCGAIDRK